MISRRSRLLLVLLVFFLSLYAATVVGQEVADAKLPALYSLSLEELTSIRVQVASKTQESILQSSGTVYVITEDMIRQYGWRDLREILQAVPNLDLEWSHNLLKGGQRGFRGSFERTVILIDGRKWNNVFAEEALITDGTYPASQIKRVEVLQGPNSSLYGTEAMDGVINIVTKFGEEGEDGIEGQYMVGEADTRGGSAVFRVSGEDYVLGGSMSTFKSDRDYDELAEFHANTADYSRNASDATRDLDPDNFWMEAHDETFDLYGRFKWFYGGVHFKQSYSDASMIRPRDPGSYIADRDQAMLFGGMEYPILQDLDFLVEYHHITSNDRFSSIIGENQGVEDHFSKDHKFLTQLDFQIPMNQIIAGFEWERRDTNRFTAADQFRSTDHGMDQEELGENGAWNKYTAFIQDTFSPVPQFKLTPGVNFLRRDYLDDNVLFRVNAVYSPVETTALKVTYGEGQRGPSVFEVQNALSDLPPQLMKMLELNYSQQLTLGPLELLNIMAGYRMASEDAYVTLPSGTGTGHITEANGETFVVWGLEDSLRFSVDRFSGFLGLRYAQPDESEVTIGPADNQYQVSEILDIAQWKLNGGLSYRWFDYLQTSLFYLYWGEQKTQANTVALDGTEIYRIPAQHRFNLNMELGEFRFQDAALSFAVYVENLFDQDFYHSNRGTSPVQYLQEPRFFRFTGRMVY